MKLIAKINRGLILTVLVVLAAVIYLVALNISRGSQKAGIEQTCRKYIDAASGYKMLPSEYRNSPEKMTADELNGYLSKMDGNLRSYFPDDATYNNSGRSYRSDLKKQAKGSGVVYAFTKKNLQFKSFSFDGGTVTVTIASDTLVDQENNSGLRSSVSGTATDTVILKKAGGKWKIVYAQLASPSSSEQANSKATYTVKS